MFRCCVVLKTKFKDWLSDLRIRHPSMVANTVGIEMPADFPLATYNDIHAHIAPLQSRFPDAYRHHADALATELRDLRNVLSHRVASTRSYVMPTKPGPNPPVRWEIDHLEARSGIQVLSIDSQLTKRYRSWAAGRLNSLFTAISGFFR